MTDHNWLEQFKAQPKAPKYQDAIRKIDRYDLEDLEAMKRDIKAYRDARNRLCDVAENTGGHLTSDTTMGFYKVDPQLRDVPEMEPRFIINQAVQAELMKTPEWEQLRRWTQGDIVNTAMSFVDVEELLEALYDKVNKEMEERAKKLEEAQQKLADALDAQMDLDQMMEDWKEGGKFDADSEENQAAQEAAQALQEAIDALTEEAGEAGAEMAQAAQGAAKGAMPGLKKAMGEAADKSENLSNAARGFGMDPGQLQRMPAAERVKLAQRLDNERFRKLSELIGPMMRVAQTEQKRKVYHVFEEVFDIGVGNDLSRLLPAEMLNLADEHTEYDFYRRYSEGKLMQYEMSGTEKVGKGGIIMEMDNSGSMRGAPEVWAKAVGLALLAIAKDQKRSFYGIHFGSRSELMEFDFSTPELATLERVLDYAEFFFGGGPLRVDQRVVTPDGMKPIGAIQFGDMVYGPDGKPVQVTGVYPQGVLDDMYKVTFKDGSEVICDGTHLWTVADRGRSGYAMSSGHVKTRTVRLAEMVGLGVECTNGYRFSVPMTAPVVLPHRPLGIHPYLLGTLLGNGQLASTSPRITGTPGDELPWAQRLPDGITPHLIENRLGFAPTHQLVAGTRGSTRQNSLTDMLRDLGLWGCGAADKFIPDEYLWASVAQRWNLLQGLCDTDGSFAKPGRLEYTTVSEKLADGVVQLVQSLGGAARIKVVAAKPAKNELALHRVSIMLNSDDCPFKLARKAAQWQPRHHPWIRSIVSIERVEPAECVCIKVDREDGLFLTEGHVVTHNTDFVRPLSRALELLQAEEKEYGYTKGDVVFVTDGVCSVPNDWLESFNEERERLGFKVWGIVIGGSRASEPLLSICNGNVVSISDLLSGESVREMFREV